MAVAAGVAFLAAQILGLTEVYWAPIAALNVVNSDSNATSKAVPARRSQEVAGMGHK
jgi:hypothetical protein